MTTPKHQAMAGIHTLDWEDLHIRIRIDRLRNERENVTGEITIRTTNPGVANHLHQARLNLTSTTARRSLAKALEERIALAWDAIIEQACVMVLAKHREGEPVLHVGQIPVREALNYRVEPLMPSNQPTLIYGPGGTGKSFFALYLSVLIGGAWHHNGYTPEPGRVLYLDYETDQYEIADRTKAIVAGLGVEGTPDIFYRFCASSLTHEVEDIQGMVAEHNIDTVVVDPLGGAVGEDMNDSEPILAYFRALRALRSRNGLSVTSLSIDHTNKEGKLFGSEYKFHRSRSIFEAKKQQDAGADYLDFGLYHRKANNSKMIPPKGYRLDFGDGWVTFTPKDVSSVPELAKALPTRTRIAEELKHGLMTAMELAKALEKTDNIIRTELKRGRELDLFVKMGDTWGLKAHEE